jgi:hypothetical protein
MKTKLRIYVLLAFIAIAIASTVYALPSDGHDIVYYSDDTYETVVGETYVGCGGNEAWGDRTGYSDEITWDCESGMTVACDRVFCYGYYTVDQYGGVHWDHCEKDQAYCGW